jgi:hypothetical protein
MAVPVFGDSEGAVERFDVRGMVVVNFLTEYQFADASELFCNLGFETYPLYLEAVAERCEAAQDDGHVVLVGTIEFDDVECRADGGAGDTLVQVLARCEPKATHVFEDVDGLWALSNCDTAMRLASWCGESQMTDFDEVVEAAARRWNPLTALFERLVDGGAVISFSTALEYDDTAQRWLVDVPVIWQDDAIAVPSELHMDLLIRLFTLGCINGGVLALRCFDGGDDLETQSVFGWGLGPDGVVALDARSSALRTRPSTWDNSGCVVYCDAPEPTY